MIAAQLLLTSLALLQGLATPLIDFNRTHATHPLWPGHARFHVVWQGLNVALLSVLTAWLIWSRGDHAAARFYLAALLTAIPSLGFVLAQSSKALYRGTLSDPQGIPPLRLRLGAKTFEMDGNATAVYVALTMLVFISALFHHAASAR